MPISKFRNIHKSKHIRANVQADAKGVNATMTTNSGSGMCPNLDGICTIWTLLFWIVFGVCVMAVAPEMSSFGGQISTKVAEMAVNSNVPERVSKLTAELPEWVQQSSPLRKLKNITTSESAMSNVSTESKLEPKKLIETVKEKATVFDSQPNSPKKRKFCCF